jgi:hypothetical protein
VRARSLKFFSTDKNFSVVEYRSVFHSFHLSNIPFLSRTHTRIDRRAVRRIVEKQSNAAAFCCRVLARLVRRSLSGNKREEKDSKKSGTRSSKQQPPPAVLLWPSTHTVTLGAAIYTAHIYIQRLLLRKGTYSLSLARFSLSSRERVSGVVKRQVAVCVPTYTYIPHSHYHPYTHVFINRSHPRLSVGLLLGGERGVVVVGDSSTIKFGSRCMCRVSALEPTHP